LKKASQVIAAWDFVEHLVKIGQLSEKDVPPKQGDAKPAAQEKPMDTDSAQKVKKTKEFDPNAPIRSRNIRSYLNTWCRRNNTEAEYVIEERGLAPNVTYACKLTVSGWQHVTMISDENRKVCMIKAAWDFIDYLVKIGQVQPETLPKKQLPIIETIADESPEVVAKYGGWDWKNSRGRLNEFYQCLTRSEPPYQTQKEAIKDSDQHRFNCKITLNVKAVDKVFVASGQAIMVKNAKAKCALSLVRQLFAAGLLERCGEKPRMKPECQVPAAQNNDNRKRKAEVPQVGSKKNGHWTPELSRIELNRYCQVNKLASLTDLIQIGERPSEDGKTKVGEFSAAMKMTVKLTEKVQTEQITKELTSSSSGRNKKLAAQNCAFDMLMQLYKLGVIGKYTEKKRKNTQTQQGNYTPEMSRMRIHEFCLKHKLTCDYNITDKVGQDKQPSFEAELKLLAPIPGSADRQLTSFGTGPSQKAASQNCSYIMLLQLLKLGAVGPNIPEQKKKPQKAAVEAEVKMEE
jgi:dsRNA-specific ribonuclease